MQLILYTNSSPLNYLSRSLSNATTITGHLRDATDILNVDVVVSYDVNYLNKNYCYIADFGRYYYFRESPTVDGKTIILHLHSDALYNYRAIIMRSPCIAQRSSSDYNLNIPDSAVISEVGYDYFTGVLPYRFTPENGQYVLTVSGG